MSTERRRHFSMIRDFHLADFLTLANGCAGAAAIFAAMQHFREPWAGWVLAAGLLIAAALVFDVLDGRVARGRTAASAMGRELDSLADVISFGVSPACLAYAIGMTGLWDVVALLYFVACGISRLARYNVTAEALAAGHGKVAYFEGTPIPSSTLLVVLLVALAGLGRIGAALPLGAVRLGPAVLHPLVLLFVLSGSLMISKTLRIPKPWTTGTALASRLFMAIEDLWYKNAIIYCLDVEKFMDADGDGVGDFEGLSRRLDYLHGLGVTCIWLQPFYPSPNRDNGYDVTDFYGVHAKHGSPGDFVECMNHAKALGMRVIVDLVVNHTSLDHPWFQAARANPQSPFRDWYVWSDERPKDHDKGVVFPGVQRSTWTLDDAAGMWYFHRFYDHQPDLNTRHPAVRDEIKKIMGYWLELGVSGFRMDAVPFLIERKGAGVEPERDFGMLREMRAFLSWRCRDAIMLAEANVVPEESIRYFGDEGDHLQMMLNFPVNQRLWYALATGETGPLVWALQQTARRPRNAQWVHFLRSHDECDLGRLSPEQRAEVFAALAPDKRMQLYDRGIRRRLAPMLGNDRRRLELALSLLFSLPGTPMMQYGDEIGMGDDLVLDERECARTPMQWTSEPHGGFSRAERTVRPVIDDPEYGYRKVNVADQRRETESLLNWCERRIRLRKECPELGWGDVTVLRTSTPEVLVLRYDFRGVSMVTLHNFSHRPKTVVLDPKARGGNVLTDVFDEHHSRTENGVHELKLPAYGHRWMRVGAVDNTLNRLPF